MMSKNGGKSCGDCNQLETLTRNDFIKASEGISLLGNFRARLFKSRDIPILCDFSLYKNLEVLVIDNDYDKSSEQSAAETSIEEKIVNNGEDSIKYGGSPLKFEFLTLSALQAKDGFKSVEHEYFQSANFFNCNPLSEKESAFLMNRLSSWVEPTFSHETLRNIPLWIVTDCKDIHNTIMFGISKSKDSMDYCRIQCFGRGNAVAKKYLLVGHHCQRISGLEERSKAVSVINIIRRTHNVETDYKERVSGFMQISATWNCSDNSLLMIPPLSAPLSVHLLPGWLDSRMPLFGLAVELRFIISLARALRTGSMKWDNLNGSSYELIIDKVKKLIEEERNAKRSTGSKKPFRDFTGRLWKIMLSCNSASTLIDVLKTIFAILRSRTFVVTLHSDNRSQLARLISDSASEKGLILPRLEGLTPIQILLEIGVEDFHRSCTEQFLTNEYVTSKSELDFFLIDGFDKSPEDRADSLLAYYYSLVAMAACKQYLNLNKHQFRTFARQVISKYCLLKISPSSHGICTEMVNKFTIDLSTGLSVMNIPPAIYDIKKPVTWALETIYSKGAVECARTMVHFTKEARFPFVYHGLAKKIDHVELQESFRLDEEGNNDENELKNAKNDRLRNAKKKTFCEDFFDDYYCSVLIARLNLQNL
ncbi:unnamed protein product [Dracunculus medinensis]|uniref:Protein zwilch n=1 Tax=Dracunculus medinensis TaxID=318479 RepID=A0A0N4U6C1_DRAME|nr:unnamed protein product [Dracunculus medinensis]